MSIADTLRGIFSSKKSSSKLQKKSTGVFQSSEDLILDTRLDSKKIRDIWYNTVKEYKLAASTVVCAIKALTSYTGIPQVKCSNNAVQKKLQKGINKIAKSIHTREFLEGNVFVWSSWNPEKNEIDHILYSTESMDKPVFDIDTKELIQVSFKHKFDFFDDKGNRKTCDRTQIFTKDSIITEFTGDIPPGRTKKEIKKNIIGVLPVVLHSYNKFPDEALGHGFVEAAEPYLACLSEILLNRVIEDKRSSRKKLNVTTKDPDMWRQNTLEVNGKSLDDKLYIEDIDIIMNVVDSDSEGKTEYLAHGQSAQDSLQIATWLQESIFEIFSTPEFVFPEKLGASFASVTAQVPNWVHHIESIRENLVENWIKQIQVDAAILSKVSRQATNLDIQWKRLDLETPEVRAKIVKMMIEAATIAKTNALLTPEEIRVYLDEYMNNLGQYSTIAGKFPEMTKFVMDKVKETVTEDV